MALLIKQSHRAMGTCFEAYLSGEDRAHLESIFCALWDTVRRLEQMMSRFDLASEVSRINRSARREPVRVSRELFAILDSCCRYREQTDGYFDVVVVPRGTDDRNSLELDPTRCTVRLCREDAAVDLGAFGKGYALDRLAEFLKEFGVHSALLHAGTSSVLAIGNGPENDGWPVGIADPFVAAPRRELMRLPLCDRALSCSAVFRDGQVVSDIVNPIDGQPLCTQAACVVLAKSAAEAEAFSTGCLAMGFERAAQWAARPSLPPDLAIGIVRNNGVSNALDWLSEPGRTDAGTNPHE